MKDKPENQTEKIEYFIDKVTSEKDLQLLLRGDLPKKGKFIGFKKQIFKMSVDSFKQAYQKLQAQFSNQQNETVIISIFIPNEEKYDLITDSRKISKIDFLSLFHENISQEEDLEEADYLYNLILNDFIEQPSMKKDVLVTEQKSVEDIQPTEKAEEKLKEEEKQKKKSQQNSEKQAMVHESETQQEIKKEESKTISIHPKLYELVNINKKQVLIDDPDYATHKINEEKRKVNKIVSDNAGALETEINQVFQEQLSILDRQREAKLIAYQNELLSSSDPKELLSIFAEKDSEIHEQKKEAIFNLNEQENKAIEELEKRFEIEKEQLRLEFLSKKTKTVEELSQSFTQWIKINYHEIWKNFYQKLSENSITYKQQLIDEKNKKALNFKNQIDPLIIQGLEAYDKEATSFLDNRIPKLKENIKNDLEIYAKQQVIRQEQSYLTKDELKRFEENQKKLEASIDELKNTKPIEIAVDKIEEPKKKEPIIAINFTKRMKMLLVSILSLFIVLGLGVSVYKKVTYVPPFDTLISDGQYKEAVKNYPNKKYEVVDTLYKKIVQGDTNKISKLEEINKEKKTALASFDLLILDKEFDEALNLYEKKAKEVPAKYWDNQASLLSYCYLKKGNLEKAKNWQKKADDEVLNEKISKYSKAQSQLNKLKADNEKLTKELKTIKDKKKQNELDEKIKEQKLQIEKIEQELKNI
ncbi:MULTISPECIES: hypothetical protein [Lactobacillales]|uniref:hypothetical protein n=1 Tax=Lactobacillales TaxID=186826 RepID=UPI00245533D6|nr:MULTISPECIES: hypothetical protein [Lactobacillales]MDH5039490.1 hypothetical protein [Enterococcus faecalis]MDM7644471.1 hypothetical protein [Lactococcus lactis]